MGMGDAYAMMTTTEVTAQLDVKLQPIAMVMEPAEGMAPVNVTVIFFQLIVQLHVKLQLIVVVMNPAEAVAAPGIAVQSKVNVEFMKETVIVMKNVRVL